MNDVYHIPTIGDTYSSRVKHSSPCYKYNERWVLWANNGEYDKMILCGLSKGPDSQDVMKGTLNLLEPE